MSSDPLHNPVTLKVKKKIGGQNITTNMVIHTTYNTEQIALMHNIEKGNIFQDILCVLCHTFLVRFQDKKHVHSVVHYSKNTNCQQPQKM